MLTRQVLSACADNTSVGRAYRVSVTCRAGPFGRDGFPVQSITQEVIEGAAETIRQYPQNVSIYLPNGAPPVPGTRFFQKDLAASFLLAPIVGHAGDGNFHVVFVLNPNHPKEMAEAERLDRIRHPLKYLGK